jgi:hypothetical protein
VKAKKPDILKKGAVYDTDGRKGLLTLRLLEDVDLSEDGFFDAEIVEGRASFASQDNRIAQKLDGLGTPGTALTFRTTLTHFKKRRPELEQARRKLNGKGSSR